MGIVLYWVHDTSPECERTYRLIEAAVPLADRLIRLSRLPVSGPLIRQLLLVIDIVRG